MHKTRQLMPKTWALRKKGKKYISADGNSKTIPLFVVMRDMIKNSNDRRDAKKMIKEKDIRINNKKVHDNKFPVRFGDIIQIENKTYILRLGENRKLQVKEIKEKQNKIVLKVINKKIRRDGNVQINCLHGKNYLVQDKESKKINVGDSIIINLDNKKIDEIIKLEEGEKVFVMTGKHTGKRGIVKKMDIERKSAEIKTEDGEINILLKYLMVEK
jgi:small subunit ribosomal protein S4e